MRTKPFLCLRVSVRLPGRASNASLAPPTMSTTALPRPLRVNRCSMLLLLHEQNPTQTWIDVYTVHAQGSNTKTWILANSVFSFRIESNSYRWSQKSPVVSTCSINSTVFRVFRRHWRLHVCWFCWLLSMVAKVNKKAQLTQRERAAAVHVWRPTANKCKIHKNLYFSTQGHSRSLLSVSIETHVWPPISD